MVVVPGRGADVSKPVTTGGPFHPVKGPILVVGVLILVNIHQAVLAEVDRIGTGRETTVVLIGIEDLDRQRFPSAGGAAVEEPCPALTEAPELLLDVGDQLVGYGVPVRPQVG